MALNQIFRSFCKNRFDLSPLHYISSHSNFGFEFAEAKLIFVQIATLSITDTRSRRLSDSTIRGVGDSPYQRYAESSTPRLKDTGSRRLTVSLVREVNDSTYQQYREFSFKKFNSRLSLSEIAGSRFSNTNISANSKQKSERVGTDPQHWPSG
jgi:hypothetical protein